MNRPQLLAYIKTLPDELQKIYQESDRFVISARDTLSDDFQIAAEITGIFEKYAQRLLGEPGS